MLLFLLPSNLYSFMDNFEKALGTVMKEVLARPDKFKLERNDYNDNTCAFSPPLVCLYLILLVLFGFTSFHSYHNA